MACRYGDPNCAQADGRIDDKRQTQRDRALSSFIRYFNRYRPHSAAGGRALPPGADVAADRRRQANEWLRTTIWRWLS